MITRYHTAALTLVSLLGAWITYELGGYLPIVVALWTFELFGLCAIAGAVSVVAPAPGWAR